VLFLRLSLLSSSPPPSKKEKNQGAQAEHKKVRELKSSLI
jgi:hypothetical protein